MTAPVDRTAYLKRQPRLRIAAFCYGNVRTRQDVANHLKRPLGGISSIDHMLAEGALRETKKVRNRAPLLTLDRRWKEAVDSLRSTESDIGRLQNGDAIFLLPVSQLKRAATALKPLLGTRVRWGVQLPGDKIGMVIGVSNSGQDSSDLHVVDRLAAAGIEAVRLPIHQEPMNAHQLEDWAESLSSGGDSDLMGLNG